LPQNQQLRAHLEAKGYSPALWPICADGDSSLPALEVEVSDGGKLEEKFREALCKYESFGFAFVY
jgi:hypothetical protein